MIRTVKQQLLLEEELNIFDMGIRKAMAKIIMDSTRLPHDSFRRLGAPLEEQLWRLRFREIFWEISSNGKS